MGNSACEKDIPGCPPLHDGPFYGVYGYSFLEISFSQYYLQGGAEALGFACQEHASEPLKCLSGVIATSPLIRQAHPAPKIQRFAAGIVSNIVPTLLLPAEVKAEDLSHDPAVYEAYKADPLIRMKGSLKGLHDMLNKVTSLLPLRLISDSLLC